MWTKVAALVVLLAVAVRFWWYNNMGQERTPSTLNPQYDYIVGKYVFTVLVAMS